MSNICHQCGEIVTSGKSRDLENPNPIFNNNLLKQGTSTFTILGSCSCGSLVVEWKTIVNCYRKPLDSKENLHNNYLENNKENSKVKCKQDLKTDHVE